MPSIEISRVVYDLLEGTIEQSDVYDDVESAVEEVLKVFLAKRDLFGRMHAPFSTVLMNCVDDLMAVRRLLEGIDWQSRREAIAEATGHLKTAEGILIAQAQGLDKEYK